MNEPPHYESIGIGDQVIVLHDDRDGDRDWLNEPSGVVVGTEDEQFWNPQVVKLSGDRAWRVEFDEPQFLRDGTGPFTETTAAGRRLVPAPTE